MRIDIRTRPDGLSAYWAGKTIVLVEDLSIEACEAQHCGCIGRCTRRSQEAMQRAIAMVAEQ